MQGHPAHVRAVLIADSAAKTGGCTKKLFVFVNSISCPGKAFALDDFRSVEASIAERRDKSRRPARLSFSVRV